MKVYQALILAGIGTFGLVAIIGLWMWGGPQYNVYRMRMEGEAKLAESQASRQVLVSEAAARKEAAKLQGEADLIKAQFQAQSAKAIASGLTQEYLQYLWIQEQGDNSNNTVIYIPTDNLGIPLMEAGRGLKAPTVEPIPKR